MTYDPVLQIYHYPCPCGDRFEIGIADLRDGEDIGVCPSCSLMIKVIYEVVSTVLLWEEKGCMSIRSLWCYYCGNSLSDYMLIFCGVEWIAKARRRSRWCSGGRCDLSKGIIWGCLMTIVLIWEYFTLQTSVVDLVKKKYGWGICGDDERHILIMIRVQWWASRIWCHSAKKTYRKNIPKLVQAESTAMRSRWIQISRRISDRVYDDTYKARLYQLGQVYPSNIL